MGVAIAKLPAKPHRVSDSRRIFRDLDLLADLRLDNSRSDNKLNDWGERDIKFCMGTLRCRTVESKLQAIQKCTKSPVIRLVEG